MHDPCEVRTIQVEVNISVLWEGVRDDPSQVKARQEVVESVSKILQQVELWTKAAQNFNAQQIEPVSADEDVEMK